MDNRFLKSTRDLEAIGLYVVGNVGPTLFQINLARLKEPEPNEDHRASTGDHLFPKVVLADCTGVVHVMSAAS